MSKAKNDPNDIPPASLAGGVFVFSKLKTLRCCNYTTLTTQAARYERNEQRQGHRGDHYNRDLTTISGDVTLKVPKFKGISFETAIIKRYRRRESSVEKAFMEM